MATEVSIHGVTKTNDFGAAEPANVAWESFIALGDLLKLVGAKESPEKAVPPTTRLTFLGNILDTIKMRIS